MTDWNKSHQVADKIAVRLFIKRRCTWTMSKHNHNKKYVKYINIPIVHNKIFSNIKVKKKEKIFIDPQWGNLQYYSDKKLRSATGQECVKVFEPCSNSSISAAGWQRALSTLPSVQLIDDPRIDPNSLQIASLTLTGSKLRQASCFFSFFHYYFRAPASVFSQSPKFSRRDGKWREMKRCAPDFTHSCGAQGQRACCRGAVEGLSCPLLDELELGPRVQKNPDQSSSGWRDLPLFYFLVK